MIHDPGAHRRRSGHQYRRPPLAAVLALVLLLAGLVAGTGYLAWWGLAHWSFFTVTEVAVEGELHRLDRQQVLAAAGISGRINMFTFSTNAMAKRILAHPWVAKVEVARHWPARLVIRVAERRPVALAVVKGELFFLDRQGRVIAPLRPGDDPDLPVITGLAPAEEGRRQQAAALQRALAFIGLAGRGREVLPRQNVSEIHLAEDGSLVLYLRNRPFPIRLGSGGTAQQYYRLARVLARLDQKRVFERTAYIRMDYLEDKVLVGLAPAAGG